MLSLHILNLFYSTFFFLFFFTNVLSAIRQSNLSMISSLSSNVSKPSETVTGFFPFSSSFAALIATKFPSSANFYFFSTWYTFCFIVFDADEKTKRERDCDIVLLHMKNNANSEERQPKKIGNCTNLQINWIKAMNKCHSHWHYSLCLCLSLGDCTKWKIINCLRLNCLHSFCDVLFFFVKKNKNHSVAINMEEDSDNNLKMKKKSSHWLFVLELMCV